MRRAWEALLRGRRVQQPRFLRQDEIGYASWDKTGQDELETGKRSSSLRDAHPHRAAALGNSRNRPILSRPGANPLEASQSFDRPTATLGKATRNSSRS